MEAAVVFQKSLAWHSLIGYIDTGIAGIAQLVERNLAKVDVAGSNPVSRSVPRQRDRRSGNRAGPPLYSSSFYDNPAAPIPPGGGVFFYRGRGSGDVPKWLRGRSAKPLCIGSNPIVASESPVSQRSARNGPLLVLCGVFDLLFRDEYFTLLRQCLVPRQVASIANNGHRHPEPPWSGSRVQHRYTGRGGGIGRRSGLKIHWAARPVPVQVRPSVRAAA